MKHTSKKRRKNKIRNIFLIILGIILVFSFIISQKSKQKTHDYVKIENLDQVHHIKGDKNAPHTLVEYSDFQCPACKNANSQIENVLETYSDKMNLEFRHFPLATIHGNALIAAQAATAAGVQGKFWKMYDILFEKQSEWGQSFAPTKFFKIYAKDINLDVEKFVFDLKSDEVKKLVDQQYNEAIEYGLPGTPSFVYNGKAIDINDFINNVLLVDEEKTS